MTSKARRSIFEIAMNSPHRNRRIHDAETEFVLPMVCLEPVAELTAG